MGVNAPGLARRQALNAELGIGENGTSSGSGAPVVSSFFPIERYYDAADKVLASFQQAYKNRELDDAYVFGKRYCSFCIESIPKHNYYSSPKYASVRSKHLKSVNTVLMLIEDVNKWMDAEELEKQKKREAYMRERARLIAEREEQERQRALAIQKQQERRALEDLERRMKLQLRPSSNDPGKQAVADPAQVQLSALQKLEMLKPPSAPPSSSTTTPTPQQPLPPPPNRSSSTRYALSDDDDEGGGGLGLESGELPPPLLPPNPVDVGSPSPPQPVESAPGGVPLPPPPPSYSAAVQTPTTSTIRRNPFLGPTSQQQPQQQPQRSQHRSQSSLPSPDAGGLAPPPSYYSATGTTASFSSLPDPPSNGGVNPFTQSNANRRLMSQQNMFLQQQQQQQQIQKPKITQKKIPVRQMRDNARHEYEKLQSQGQIVIRPINTYQGRHSQSTNGCTVISPLVVSRHLRTPTGIVLPDHEIVEVIDEQCGPLLREIRGKLGLENFSLIIPSDVHDHLVDKHLLKQEEFVGATGGNIISVEHMGEVLKLLQEKPKAGAVLFFREHVISIIKIPCGSHGQAYFDFVDSMPGTGGGGTCATRTRCRDIGALEVMLRWYATKKFTDSNCAHIDRSPWDENMADFDPRVFQVFVWGKDA